MEEKTPLSQAILIGLPFPLFLLADMAYVLRDVQWHLITLNGWIFGILFFIIFLIITIALISGLIAVQVMNNWG